MSGFRDRDDRCVHASIPGKVELTYYTRGRRWYLEPVPTLRARNPISARSAAAAGRPFANSGGTDLAATAQALAADELPKITRTDQWTVSDLLRGLGVPVRPKADNG